MDHLAINSTTAVAAEARVTPALPATEVVEFMAKWSNLYPHTVIFFKKPFQKNCTINTSIVNKKFKMMEFLQIKRSCSCLIIPNFPTNIFSRR